MVTAFRKQPRAGPVRVFSDHLEGDEQADERHHGGPRKAAYVYPSEHYGFWTRELGKESLPWGSFGENLTTMGLVESDVRTGDQIQIGGAVFVVTSPRTPCYKMNVSFERDSLVDRFLNAGRSGFYLAVSRPGTLHAGDPIELVTSGSGPSIATQFRSRNAPE